MKMDLRTLILERISFALDDEELMQEFMMTFEEVKELEDLDLLELFEDTVLITKRTED